MKRLEVKEGKCLRSRRDHLGDEWDGRFHSVAVPGALMKDFRRVTRAGSALVCFKRGGKPA